MKNSISIVVLHLFLAIASQGQSDNEKQIIETFNNYRLGMTNEITTQAISAMDSTSMAYYDHILNKINYGDSLRVDSLPMPDKLLIFSIRHQVSKKEILSFNTKGLIAYGIKNGMISKMFVEGNSITNVNVGQGWATAQLVYQGKITLYFYKFRKEKGKWKIDVTSVLGDMERLLIRMRIDSGLKENEYLFSVLEGITKRKPGKEIWRPVKQ